MAPKIWIGSPMPSLSEDCACPETSLISPSLRSSYTTTPVQGWQQAPELYRVTLTPQQELLFRLQGDGYVVVLDREAAHIFDKVVAIQAGRNQPACMAYLDDEERVTAKLSQVGMLQAVGTSVSPLQRQVDTLAVWLHVTNQCNLRCTYCYLDKTEESMSISTAKAAVASMVRTAQQHGFTQIALKYAGGESILNFSLIRTVHEELTAEAEAHGIQVKATVLSNGIALTNVMLEFFRKWNIGLMISLDSVADEQDDLRLFANGQGSFRQAIHGIDRAIAQGVQPHLSITVTNQNIDQLSSVIAFALARKLRFNLNFYRDYDCYESAAELRADQQRLIRGLRAALQVVENNLPAYRIIDSLLDRSAFNSAHTHACGAGHNYLVIDQGGRIARCQMEIEKPITTIYADDPLRLIQQQSDGWNLPAEEKEGCRSCHWRSWCAGGCPLLTARVTGRTDIKSPYCEVYKALFPELLRLEGLRLLKWGSDVE